MHIYVYIYIYTHAHISVDTFIVLGHTVQSNGSIRACWTKARTAMWKSYWANPGATAAQNLSVPNKLALMSRVVTPQISFRCSRWPPQRTVAVEVDTLQQKMTASLLRLPRLEGEEADSYVRRRGRAARKQCSHHGLWSQQWFKRVIAWDEHLSRRRNFHTWAAKLRDYRGKTWLMQRRASFAPSTASIDSPASATAGRTGTRSFAGIVHTRWHDGVDFAKFLVKS